MTYSYAGFVSGLLATVLLVSSAGDAPAGDATPPPTVAEAGQRFGLIEAASEFCPGGVITEKGRALESSFTGADAATFKAEADKVVEAWRAGARCKEGEMTSTELSMCRTMRLRNCRAVWLQMGPNGSVMPGLLDIDLSKVGD